MSAGVTGLVCQPGRAVADPERLERGGVVLDLLEGILRDGHQTATSRPGCRHRRELRQQLPHATLERVERDGPLTRTYLGGELDFTARDTVSRESPSRAAIARTDMPSLPWRYLIYAQPCTVITHPIVVGWPIFKEHTGPVFKERRHAESRA